jgi:methanethiol S-methyltransferase
MSRAAYLLYGLLAYFLFFAAILYGIGFVGNLAVPKGIDGGAAVPRSTAIAVNVLLLLLFAVQHNVMAARFGPNTW